jgi:hypothetical protein
VPAPGVTLSGEVTVDGVPMVIDGWIGSQNHNWGSQHTDEYAWGQVAGFDGEPDAFLECSTARVRVAGVPTPWLSPIVVRYSGGELRLNAIGTCLRAKASYEHAGEEFRWTFRSRGCDDAGRRVTVSGEITAPRAAFVELRYLNPPGGEKTCLNTKIGRCRLRITHDDGTSVELTTAHRAAFEILTN